MTKQNPTPAGGAQLLDAGFVHRREWMLYKISDDHYPLNINLNFELDRFDRPLFQKVMDKLVERHQILRTTLRVADGRLKQVIHAPSDFRVDFAYFDLREESPGEQERFIGSRKLIQMFRPFNFEFGPLFRVLVFAKSNNRYEVEAVFHHAIFDQYSVHVFIKDAVAIWQAVYEGTVENLVLGEGQYQSYARYENELLETAAGDPYRQYWQEQLTGDVPRLQIIAQDKWDAYYESHRQKVEEVRKRLAELPFYDRRFLGSVVRRFRPGKAGMLDYQYGQETQQNIVDFKRHTNSSTHAFFIASFLAALHQLSGQEVFAFDFPGSRRTDGDFKNTIGWLAGGGICFFRANQQSAAELIAHVDRQLFLLARYCAYPFEAAAPEAEVPIGSAVPVFITLTETDAEAGSAPATPKGMITGIKQHGGAAHQDLALFINLHPRTCTVKIIYNSFLFSPELVEKIARAQEASLNNLSEAVLAASTTIIL